MRPWHGGVMAAVALLISQYLWTVAEGAPSEGPAEFFMILCFIGLVALTPCVAYEGSSDSSEGE